MSHRLHKGDAFPFSHNALLRVPRIKHVVYLFWSESKACCVYVGKTKRSLQQRLREHWLHCDNPMLHVWIHSDPEDLKVCYISCQASDVLKLERRLIRRLDPNANKEHKT